MSANAYTLNSSNMSANAYTLPWHHSLNVSDKANCSSSNANEDSAFHEYSNPASSNSFDSCLDSSSPCPDYEEVTTSAAFAASAAMREVGYVYNVALATEKRSTDNESDVFSATAADGSCGSNAVDKEKIMTSKVFCIHKVSYIIQKCCYMVFFCQINNIRRD
jgi:hypothetical protein